MTTLVLPIRKVSLRDGTTAVINAVDFDPAIHTDIGAAKTAPPKKKSKKRSN